MGGCSRRINIWAGSAGKKGLGFCVICGQFGKLTRDHVPPQGCVQITNAVLSRLTGKTPSEGQPRSTVYIRVSLKFQPLCATCNSERLWAIQPADHLEVNSSDSF